MQIEEVTINHYKSIKNPVCLRDFFDFHILVGPNNAGKTNLLDAIHIFFEEKRNSERLFDKDADIKMTVKINGKKVLLEYKNQQITSSEDINLSHHYIRIGEEFNYLSVAGKLKDFRDKHYQEYLKFTNTLEKYFKEIEINEELFLLNIYADHKKRPVKRMGEGFKRLFAILFYIFHPQYRTILIDEPEIHLHPSIIKKFLQILESNDLGNQILLTTHHPTFIQARYLPHVWRISRNKENSTSVYVFRIKDLDLERFIQEINDDNSSMLFADKVLLVEGISDCIFMREMINRFYQKDKDIKLVYTSGKGSVDLYANLCEIFNIPYAIMLDKDAFYSSSLQRVKGFSKITKKAPLSEKINLLKKEEIFLLEKDLEHTYPQKYKSKETKPLQALSISKKITLEDLNQKRMKTIKAILTSI